MTTSTVLLATRNAGKLRELRAMFTAAGIEVQDLTDAGIRETAAEDAVEAFETFEENARAKARYFFEQGTGQPVVADDSGLEVAALGGAPGVHSKRWSGRLDLAGQALDDANNALLLARLGGAEDRRARYACVVVWWDGLHEIVAQGETTGSIARERTSGSGGFGYDPYFVSDVLGRSFADMEEAEKARVSHRGRAFAELLRMLVARG